MQQESVLRRRRRLPGTQRMAVVQPRSSVILVPAMCQLAALLSGQLRRVQTSPLTCNNNCPVACLAVLLLAPLQQAGCRAQDLASQMVVSRDRMPLPCRHSFQLPGACLTAASAPARSNKDPGASGTAAASGTRRPSSWDTTRVQVCETVPAAGQRIQGHGYSSRVLCGHD
jgi:hypothetical protein